MQFTRFSSLALAGFVALSAPAFGQTTVLQEPSEGNAVCTGTDQIVTLANEILKQRADLPRLGQANFGTEAAYLWLRYTKPAFEDGLAWLDDLSKSEGRPPRQIEDMMLAYAYANLSPDQALEALGLAQDAPLVGTQGNADAALIVADDGKTFFAMLEKALEDGSVNHRYVIESITASRLYYLDDDKKQTIAMNAEATGNLLLASYILASSMDHSAYNAFLGRHSDNEFVLSMSPDFTGSNALNHGAPFTRGNATLLQRFIVMRAGLLIGEADFLSILMNQSGWETEISLAAMAFLTRHSAGATSSVGALEENWLFVYDMIASFQDPQALANTMSRFDITTKVRHYAGSAQQTVDWMRATQALIPYMTQKSDEMPLRPALLSADFDWDAMQGHAASIRQGDTPVAANETEAMMIAELLVGAGQVDAALAFAQEHLAPKPRLTFFRDILKRLDRKCAAYSVMPGQSLLLGGQMALRFD